MNLEVSFVDVCKFIEAEHPTALPQAKKLLALLVIFSPAALGLPLAAIAPSLGLLTLKNELIDLGQTLLGMLTSKGTPDPGDQRRSEL